MVKGLTEDAVKRLASLKTQIEQRFERVDTRLDAMDSHLGSMETSFDRVESRFDLMDTHLDRVENMLAQILTRLPKNPSYTLSMLARYLEARLLALLSC